MAVKHVVCCGCWCGSKCSWAHAEACGCFPCPTSNRWVAEKHVVGCGCWCRRHPTLDPHKHARGSVNQMHRSMCLDVVADAGATLTCSWTLGNIWMTWLFIVILEIGIPGRTMFVLQGACRSRELCVISTELVLSNATKYVGGCMRL